MPAATVSYFLFKPTALHVRQLELSVLSLLHYSQCDLDIVVYSSDALPSLQSLPNFTVVVVSEEKFKSWMGPQQFMWRAKIVSLLESLQKRTKVLYLDTDVACSASLQPLLNNWQPGESFMNLRERRLDEKLEAKSNRYILKNIVGRTVAGLTVTGGHAMWNAGVVGVHAADGAVVQRALAICDALLAEGIEVSLTEQLSLSLALQTATKLQASGDALKHFWANKEIWNAAYEKFCRQYPTLAQRREHFGEFSMSWPLQGEVVRKSFLDKQKNSIRKRWAALIGGVRK